MAEKKRKPKDPDLANVEKALKRAAKSARLLAKKTKTPCYVVEEGNVVNVAETHATYGARRKL
jgi:predicted GNAT family acetyltransferase